MIKLFTLSENLYWDERMRESLAEGIAPEIIADLLAGRLIPNDNRVVMYSLLIRPPIWLDEPASPVTLELTSEEIWKVKKDMHAMAGTTWTASTLWTTQYYRY